MRLDRQASSTEKHKNAEQMTKHIRILSVDGGGIRGIIPLIVLKYIEKKSNKSIRDLFDYFAGTSTGGIVVLGLNSRKGGKPEADYFTAQDLLKIYLNEGQRIFPGGPKGPGKFLAPQYESSGIETFIKDKFGEKTRLSQLTSNEFDKCVAVYSYDIERDEPYVFSTNKAKPYSYSMEPYEAYPFSSDKTGAFVNEDDYYVWEAARSTSAAPTFFPAYKTSSPISGTTTNPLARATSRGCFSLTSHNGDLYLSWIDANRGFNKGNEESEGKDSGNLHKVFCSFAKQGLIDDGWSVPQKCQPLEHWALRDGGVATVSFKSKLHTFWTTQKYEGGWKPDKPHSGTNSIAYSTSGDGINWSEAKKFPHEIAYFCTPAVTVFNDDRLYIAWRGAGDFNNRLYYTCMYFDGTWLPEVKTSDKFRIDSKYANPALAAYNGRLYIAWRGENAGKNRIFIASAPGLNTMALPDFGEQEEVGAKSESSGEYYSFEIDDNTSPSLAVFQGKLFMAWRGAKANNNRIYYSTFNGKSWSDQRWATSSDGPFHINEILGDPEYLADDWHVFRISSTSSPVLTTLNKKFTNENETELSEILYMAWHQRVLNEPALPNDFLTINYSAFDGTDWSSVNSREVSTLPRVLVDGGIYINNPTIDIYKEARKLEKDATMFTLVSLGTGEFRKYNSPLSDAAAVSWIVNGGKLLDCMMRGASAITHKQMEELANLQIDVPVLYERFNFTLPYDIELDGVDSRSLDRLQWAGDELVKLNKERLDWLVEILLNNKIWDLKKEM